MRKLVRESLETPLNEEAGRAGGRDAAQWLEIIAKQNSELKKILIDIANKK